MNGIKKRSSKVIENLGPVDNLESYVKADWWKEIFNANYLAADGDRARHRDLHRIRPVRGIAELPPL